MNDFDLESKLKSLRVPERSQDFWQEFPQKVMGELRATRPLSAPGRATLPRSRGLAWVTSTSLACLAFGICLGQSQVPKEVCFALVNNEKELRQTVRQFPNHVRTLMQDEHGLHKLIEDQP